MLLVSDSFGLASPAATAVCSGMAAGCIGHTVTAGQTLEQIAATYGTTVSQLADANDPLSPRSNSSMWVALHPNDVLAVLPAPGEETRWLWNKTAGGTPMQIRAVNDVGLTFEFHVHCHVWQWHCFTDPCMHGPPWNGQGLWQPCLSHQTALHWQRWLPQANPNVCHSAQQCICNAYGSAVGALATICPAPHCSENWVLMPIACGANACAVLALASLHDRNMICRCNQRMA
jgi:hypothetical protein